MIVFVDKSNNPMINPKEEYHRVRKKHLGMKSNQSNNTRNCCRLDFKK